MNQICSAFYFFQNVIEEILQNSFIFIEVGLLANVISHCKLIVSILSVVLRISCKNVPNSVLQRVTITFFPNGDIRYQRLYKQFEEVCLSLRTDFEWCKSFKDGREHVSNLAGKIMTRVFWDDIGYWSTFSKNGKRLI